MFQGILEIIMQIILVMSPGNITTDNDLDFRVTLADKSDAQSVYIFYTNRIKCCQLFKSNQKIDDINIFLCGYSRTFFNELILYYCRYVLL